MKVKITLSANLRGIYTEIPPETTLELSDPISIENLLSLLGIKPQVVVVISVNDVVRDKKFLVKENANIVFIGPVLGG